MTALAILLGLYSVSLWVIWDRFRLLGLTCALMALALWLISRIQPGLDAALLPAPDEKEASGKGAQILFGLAGLFCAWKASQSGIAGHLGATGLWIGFSALAWRAAVLEALPPLKGPQRALLLLGLFALAALFRLYQAWDVPVGLAGRDGSVLWDRAWHYFDGLRVTYDIYDLNAGADGMIPLYMMMTSLKAFGSSVLGYTLVDILAGIALGAFGSVTRRQLPYWKDSVALFEHTLEKDPNNFRALFNLGDALIAQGRAGAGIDFLMEAGKVKPGYAGVGARIGQALADQGKTAEAIAYYRRALQLDPRFIEALNNLSWILATTPDGALRDGNEAVRLGEEACRLTANRIPVFVGTLAAAYAEAGKFQQAVETADMAAGIALDNGNPALAETNRKLAELFRANKPYHQPPPPPTSPPN